MDYVEFVDPEYNYVELARYDTGTSDIYSLNVTSQKWMSGEPIVLFTRAFYVLYVYFICLL